jgi:hypothetical protein
MQVIFFGKVYFSFLKYYNNVLCIPHVLFDTNQFLTNMMHLLVQQWVCEIY